MGMQKEKASNPNDAGKWSLDDWDWEKSKISERDLQKRFWELKTLNSMLLTKYFSHHTEISAKNILTTASSKTNVNHGENDQS